MRGLHFWNAEARKVSGYVDKCRTIFFPKTSDVANRRGMPGSCVPSMIKSHAIQTMSAPAAQARRHSQALSSHSDVSVAGIPDRRTPLNDFPTRNGAGRLRVAVTEQLPTHTCN
jgi:hypothetical protein